MKQELFLIGGVIVFVGVAGYLATREGRYPERDEHSRVEVSSKEQPMKTEQAKKNEVASEEEDTLSQENTMELGIKTTKEGTGTQGVVAGDTVAVKYTGKLEDGTVFDATEKHGGEPFTFTVGAGQVIKGWDEGLVGMKIGELRTLTIPASLGYGASGIPGVIPGGATLLFDIELVSIN